jgi:Flp pilus assembly pilin Flp
MEILQASHISIDKTNLLKECAIKYLVIRQAVMKNRIVQIFKKSVRSFKSKRGQTLVEYGLILALISVVAISVLINLGAQTKAMYSKIDSGLASAQASH